MKWWPRCHDLIFFIFIYFNWRLITLQYCDDFCHTLTWIHHGCTCVPILYCPPTSLPIPSLWVIPAQQPWAPCLMHQTWTGDLFHMWFHTCFNAILSNHPTLSSPTEFKSLFFTSMSLSLSHIQGHHYHLSKFHIYTLIYCIGVFLSDLLHSV